MVQLSQKRQVTGGYCAGGYCKEGGCRLVGKWDGQCPHLIAEVDSVRYCKRGGRSTPEGREIAWLCKDGEVGQYGTEQAMRLSCKRGGNHAYSKDEGGGTVLQKGRQSIAWLWEYCKGENSEVVLQENGLHMLYCKGTYGNGGCCKEAGIRTLVSQLFYTVLQCISQCSNSHPFELFNFTNLLSRLDVP